MAIQPLDLLDHCPIGIPASIERSHDNYVLCLGDRILAKDRTALRPIRNPLDPDFDTDVSGSVGFMTFHPEPEYHHGVLFIYLIGVEKGHKREGHCRRMLQWSERVGQELDLEMIAITNIMSDRLRDIVIRHKYEDNKPYYGTWGKRVGL